MAVEDWLKNLALAPKTKSHVRSLMHTIFQCAERWELIDKNPIKLVRVKGGTKRLKTPRVLAPEQFHSLLPLIREPYRTMVLVAGCLGLRASEIVALQWRDFDFPGLTLLIQRSVVHGRVGDVKTEYSRDSVPLDAAVVEALMLHKERSVSDAGRVVVCQPGHGQAVPPGGDPEEAHPQSWYRGRDRRRYRLAYVSAQLSVVAGRHRGASHRPKGVDASRQHPDHDEHLREGHDGQQASGPQQSCRDGPERRQNGKRRPQDAGRGYWELMGVCGTLENPRNLLIEIGCGGRI